MTTQIPEPWHSPFTDWHAVAAVRAMPAGDWLEPGPGLWQPDEPGSVLSHPALDGHRETVAAALLLAHLRFTTVLESELISPVALDIAANRLGACYPAEVARDSLKLQCDEAFHAILAEDLVAQVTLTTAAKVPQGAHPFLSQVEAISRRMEPVHVPRFRFCAAVISETLITKSLRDDWFDPRLKADLRTFLRRHYEDERRHSAFFSQLLRMVWPQWPDETRAAIEPHWAALIDAFLDVDGQQLKAALESSGVPAGAARTVLSEAIPAPQREVRKRLASQMTFHSLQRAGALGGQHHPAEAQSCAA